MNFRKATAILLFFLPFLVFSQDGLPDKEGQKALVDRHNYWRTQVGVKPLVWSDTVAESAYQWARSLQKDDCGFYHSSVSYGENLWMGTTGYYSLAEVVDSWGMEKEDYNYTRNSCKPGKMCGHYTQMVWAKTTEVGCAAISDCEGMTLWVCQYNPPGNYVGQKPY